MNCTPISVWLTLNRTIYRLSQSLIFQHYTWMLSDSESERKRIPTYEANWKFGIDAQIYIERRKLDIHDLYAGKNDARMRNCRIILQYRCRREFPHNQNSNNKKKQENRVNLNHSSAIREANIDILTRSEWFC